MSETRGRVKWFSNELGYGFITLDADDGGGDLFVHFSEIKMDGYKKLEAGQAVTFEVAKGKNGLAAKNVVPGDGSAYLTTN